MEGEPTPDSFFLQIIECAFECGRHELSRIDLRGSLGLLGEVGIDGRLLAIF